MVCKVDLGDFLVLDSVLGPPSPIDDLAPSQLGRMQVLFGFSREVGVVAILFEGDVRVMELAVLRLDVGVLDDVVSLVRGRCRSLFVHGCTTAFSQDSLALDNNERPLSAIGKGEEEKVDGVRLA